MLELCLKVGQHEKIEVHPNAKVTLSCCNSIVYPLSLVILQTWPVLEAPRAHRTHTLGMLLVLAPALLRDSNVLDAPVLDAVSSERPQETAATSTPLFEFEDTPLHFAAVASERTSPLGFPANYTQRTPDRLTSGVALAAVPACRAALSKAPLHATCKSTSLTSTGRTHAVYSRKAGLAYLKTAKAGSVSFQSFLIDRYRDSTCTVVKDCSNTNLPLGQLPAHIFGFTFVRDPLERALAGYAEVDAIHRQSENSKKGQQQMKVAGTTFVNVPRNNFTHGAARFLAYLDDLAKGRLPRDWKPGHSCPESDPLQSVEHAVRYDFVGRLESLSEDWKLMQQLAKVPLHKRTTAVPLDHQGKNDDYLLDEATRRTDQVVRKVCELYAADYACFGYELPKPCWPGDRALQSA